MAIKHVHFYNNTTTTNVTKFFILITFATVCHIVNIHNNTFKFKIIIPFIKKKKKNDKSVIVRY